MMRQALLQSIEDCVKAAQCLQSPEAILFIEQVSSQLAHCFQQGGKVLIAGNGGSLCDAAHFAEELTGNFRKPRPALPAIALTDPGHLTCTANDYGFEQIFARAISAYGQPGDLFIALTTSGNSRNIILAVEEALRRSMTVVLFLGKEGGALKGKGHLEWIVSGFETSDRIQEAHMAALHLVIEQMERHLFPELVQSTLSEPLSQPASLSL